MREILSKWLGSEVRVCGTIHGDPFIISGVLQHALYADRFVVEKTEIQQSVGMELRTSFEISFSPGMVAVANESNRTISLK